MKAARAFYTDILGEQFWDSAGINIAPLPARAAAAGAPAHWLGHISVGDIEGTVDNVMTLGGEQLGPSQRGPDGSQRAILRDPFGAVLAVTSETADADRSPVVWHLHHSQDQERSFYWYAGLFGWAPTEAVDLGSELGAHQMFTWNESRRPVGSMANTARLPQIHPQWLFFFRVADIASSLVKVRALGGIALAPVRTSLDDILAPCDDPQGAAFGLYQYGL